VDEEWQRFRNGFFSQLYSHETGVYCTRLCEFFL
jgi:hypothetical protein